MTATQTTVATHHDPDQESAIHRFARFARGFRLGPVLVVLLLVWIFFASQNAVFLSPVNISNLTLQTAVTATIALGLVFVLLLGEIDLSVAALSGVAGAIAASLATSAGWHPALAVAAALAFGVVWSLVQSVIVLYGAPSFIVTLAGSLALAGLLLVALPEAGQITVANNDMRLIAGSYFNAPLGWLVALTASLLTAAFYYTRFRERRKRGLTTVAWKAVLLPIAGSTILIFGIVFVMNQHRGLPMMFAILMAIVGLFAYVTTQTKFGIRLYAVGGNREAARRAGIPVGRTILTAFAFSGLFAALGGVFAASRLLGVSNQSGGGSLLLEAIAAAVIGGTSLFGGKGTVWAAVLGALLIGSINNGMDLMGLPTEAKLVVTGIILVGATVADVVLSRGSFSWRLK